MPRALTAAVFLVMVLLIALVLGEAIVRIYSHYDLIYDLEMTRYSRILKQDFPDPQIGHVHRANSQAYLMGVQVLINEDGFRDKNYSIERNPKARMVILGDSLTFGWGVERENTFADMIENELAPATEVINLGIGNFNTRQEVQHFIKRGLKYRPDQVLVFFFLNDAEPIPRLSRWSFLQYSESLTLYWASVRRLLSRFEGSNFYQRYYKDLYRDDQAGWVDAKKAFIQLQSVCKRHGIDLKVVLLPELHELRDYPFKDEHAKVSAFLSRNGIQHIDLAPKFRHVEHPRTLWVASDDAHPNAIAHRMIANYLLNYLNPNK